MIGGAKGIGIGIDFGIPNQYCRATSKPYIEKDVLDSLRVVASAYGKSNDDADRSIVKNLVDASNPFIISNAAFKLNSGFGKYETELSDTKIWTQSKETTSTAFSSSYNGLSGWIIFANTELTNSADMPSFKIQVKGLLEGQELIYRYYDSAGQSNVYSMAKDGEYTLPADIRTAKPLFSNTSGLQVVKNENNIITITQIPQFEGAFVTDGVDDLITSTKTVQEMLGGSNEITIVSMVHQVKDTTNNVSFTNYIRGSINGYFRNIVNNYGKTGIYGYTSSDLRSLSVINNILGDKNDYTSNGDNRDTIINGNFSVQGYSYNNSNNTGDFSSVAWYWTVIANKVLTTDEINQVIAYYNLDRTLKPDILCNTIKQGITNENHTEFGDKLIDFSGNGRDIQLNNIAWNKESGIDDDGALCLDGVNDFGKVTGMPIYKDYTVVVNKDRIGTDTSCVLSKATTNPDVGAFITEFRTSTYSFGSINAFQTQKVGISYQSKYVYNGERELTAGSNVDTDTMWLGTIRDNDSRFFNGAIYSLMSFPYSMSEFLIERQLKKHKLGTLYPNMVEFRPIIPEDENITKIDYFVVNSGTWTVIKPGDYVDVGARIVLNVYTKLPYKIEKVSSLAFTGISVRYSAELNVFDVIGYIKDKTPQKIELTLAVNEDIVQWNPIITANANYKIHYYLIDSNNVWKSIKKGDYITIGAKLAFQITFDNDASELKEVVSSQLSDIVIEKRLSASGYNIYSTINSESPQNINITIDEYIRYEEIVQPYPVIFQITDRNTNQRYSWGDKIKVGSSIRLSQGEKPNLLSGLYSIQSYEYEGETYSYNQLTNLNIILTKQSISLSCNKTWLLDDNEPKCILSPRLLRIPNSSYKILGYIPDISGHGNHGVIHNSAYAEGSGVNEDGSYQFDGVDDFVTIPTLSSGGKQMLMKVNWNSLNHVLYDQRNNVEAPFCIVTGSGSIAYNQRNVGGNTYIDGILNNHILVDDLQAITHNIVLNNDYNVANSNSFIGTNYTKSIYAKMSLYDFMLFDNISTDDKIKELNEYVGIEAKVELPPYYWDTYGKTNSDADRDTIQQRGIAVGDYDLTNYNHAYEGMSGYNGYPVVFGASKTWANESSGYVTSITSNTIHITNVLKAGLALLYSYVKYNGNLQNIKEIPPFKIEIKGLEGRSKFIYKYLATSDATKETNLYLGNGTHELPKSFLPTEALINNAVVGFSISPIEEGVTNFLSDITIEVLPEYENGLAYDGITDYSKNANIPVLTDYTYIYKRTIINIPTNAATLLKGADKTNGGAFIADYGNKWQFNFGQYNIIQGIADGINWQTVNSFNGTSINKGENTDDSGITVAKFSNGYTSMVFYKLILYPKTISLLEINFLKNLMEKDEIIDLTNPIFIQ